MRAPVADIDWSPLLLSLRVASLATLVTTVVGVTGAYVLARCRFPGRGLLEAVASLPIVLPPTVLGYYLLVVIGRDSPIGRAYEAVVGRPLVFTWQAAVLAAAVASLPYCLRTATAAIAAVDAGYEEAARVAGLHGRQHPLDEGDVRRCVQVHRGALDQLPRQLPGRTEGEHDPLPGHLLEALPEHGERRSQIGSAGDQQGLLGGDGLGVRPAGRGRQRQQRQGERARPHRGGGPSRLPGHAATSVPVPSRS